MELKEMSIEEIKEKQLQILDSVHDFCERNSIKYFITAGTLIGALRHRGYIPWDDDIDLVMLRTDYDRFVELFNQKTDGKIKVAYHKYSKCPYSFVKVYDDETVFVEDESKNNTENIGVNIDIFPLDSITDSYDDAVSLIKEIEIYTRIVELKNVVSTKKRRLGKQITLAFLQFVAKAFSYQWCFKNIDKIALKYKDNINSKYIANVVIQAKGEREILEREWFSEQIDLPFEGKLYKAPIGYDAYMKRLFGDYMTLPPKEKQVSHHSFRAYYK